MGCSSSSCTHRSTVDVKTPVEVGEARWRPDISDHDLFQEREQESELSTVVELPEEITRKLSKRSSRRSTSKNSAGQEHIGSESSGLSNRATSSPPRQALGSRVNTKCSVDSQRDFAASSQTIIIFDWDDTLCPSTVLRPVARFDRHGGLKSKLGSEERHELKLLSDMVLGLLKSAMTMGKVILVTNAKAPWVDMSCQSFLPALRGVLKEIPVLYALELARENGLEGFDKESGCLLTETKARAMREAVSQFYSQYPNQSWKNIVSIGDAYFEHDAIRQVVGEKKQDKPCRTKTIKLLDSPSSAGMVVQLAIVKTWLPQIIRADTDVDIDLSADDEHVDKWVSLYG